MADTQESVTITIEETLKTTESSTEQSAEVASDSAPVTQQEPEAAAPETDGAVDASAEPVAEDAAVVVPPPPPGMVKSATLILKTSTPVTPAPHIDAAQADFAIRCLRQLFEKESESFAISPLGIAQQLTALEAGSLGETKKELISALPIEKSLAVKLIERLPLIKPREPGEKELEKLFESLHATDFPNVRLTNTIFLQEGFLILSAYKTYLDKHQLGHVRFTTFNDIDTCVQEINDTVSEATRNQVEDPVEAADIPPNTKLFVSNTAYVRSEWPKRFKKTPSGPSLTYHSAENKKHDIFFLTASDKFLHGENAKLRVVGLPFGPSDSLTLFVIVAKKKFGIQKALGKLDGGKLAELLAECKPVEMNVAIPQFKLRRTYDLKELLSAFGVQSSYDKRANFYGISESGRAHVVGAPHSVYVEISEGPARTEYEGAWPTKDVQFEVDSPFAYFLVNKQGGVVLSGVYKNPQPGMDEKPPLPVDDSWTDNETANVELKPQTSLSFSKITRAQADFALSLLREKVDKLELKTSLAITPLSIAILLAMCAEGAHSTTLREILNAISDGVSLTKSREYYAEALGRLRYAANDDIGQKVIGSWRAFSDSTRTFLLSFNEILQRYYPDVVSKIDFNDSVVKEINSAIAKETDDLVTELVTPASIVPNALVLVTAVGFQAKWHKKFEAQDTRKSKFSTTVNDTVEVDMLYKEDGYLYNANAEFEIVTLPYESTQFFLSVFLPLKKCALYEELPKLKGYDLLKLIHETFYRELKLFLPKFKVETTTIAKPLLENIGVKAAFKDASADFSRASPDEQRLYIGDVVEKVVFQVGEEGTSSSAPTGEVATATAGATPQQPKPVFQADHPFLYVLTDATGNVVVAGIFRG